MDTIYGSIDTTITVMLPVIGETDVELVALYEAVPAEPETFDCPGTDSTITVYTVEHEGDDVLEDLMKIDPKILDVLKTKVAEEINDMVVTMAGDREAERAECEAAAWDARDGY